LEREEDIPEFEVVVDNVVFVEVSNAGEDLDHVISGFLLKKTLLLFDSVKERLEVRSRSRRRKK
jgi:hypothetical protein